LRYWSTPDGTCRGTPPAEPTTALKELLTLDATPGPGAVIHLHYNQDGEAETIERQDESELSEQSTATS